MSTLIVKKIRPPVPADPIRYLSGMQYTTPSPSASGSTTPTFTSTHKATPLPPVNTETSGVLSSSTNLFTEFGKSIEEAKKPKNPNPYMA
jgi:hypothetical protein